MATESVNSVNNTGKFFVDGLLWGDKWTSGPVTYQFDSGFYRFNFSGNVVDGDGFDWFNVERLAVKRALAAWSSVANIQFQESSADSTDIAFYVDDLFGALGLSDTPSSPGPGQENNTTVFGVNDPSWTNAGLAKGGFAYQTILHEVGHAIGMAHPHDDGGGSIIYPGVDGPFDSGAYGMNQDAWTIMSYVSFSTHSANPLSNVFANPATPMALDIAAAQHIYGANMNFQTGNNNYVLPKADGVGTFYWCIWDAGGTDTVSTGATSTDATIDLRWAPLVGRHAGGFMSSVDGVHGGCTIANNAAIERALGGGGDDVITGNQFNNFLAGGFGGDLIRGLGGNDTLRGGLGKDALLGGIGRDVFDFNSLAEAGSGALSDRIVDFNHSQNDKIDLLSIDANSNAVGNQAFHFIGGQGFHGTAGELRFSGGVLRGDTDGDGVANFEIAVSNTSSLVVTDFVL